MTNKDHKLAAIVFTDIVGYTKQMEKDEARTMQLLQKQREIVFPIVKRYGGEIIKEIGDGLLMMFESAIEAVRCTISIQTKLKDEELTIRAGIHIGDVIFREGDVFGSAVNTAARIEPLAPPNGICISETVMKQIENKDDIVGISLGKKELKGVGRPMEIFQIFIEGVSEKQKQTIGYIFKDLWSRYVIQIMIIYLIASWILKQAVAAISSNYLLSPHLVDLAWIILISLIPAVFLLAYFHGKRSSGKWTKIETFGIPANFILTILLAVFLFEGKDLGGTTETKILENADGEKYELTVLKNEYRKKMVIFFYENEAKDTSLTWLQYAIPFLIDFDLSQQIIVQAHNGVEYMVKLKDAGYNNGLGAPWMLQKEIAEFYGHDYFMTGSFVHENEEYLVTSNIYKTESGELISEFEISNKNIFTIIDEISKNIYDGLKMPSSLTKESSDLPISEVYTSQESALENFTKGNIEIILNNDFDMATKYIELAIAEDPSFAIAHLILANYYFNNNKSVEATHAVNKALEFDYKLPERQKFLAKFIYHIFRQEPDKAMGILKMWTDLYPEDIEAHESLATRYQYKNMFTESIEEYRKILTLVPDQSRYIRFIGDLHEAMGNYDSAMYYHQQYAKLNPKDFKSYKSLGDLYLNMAEFDTAAINYDKALALDARNINIEISRIRVDMRKGEFDNVEKRYLELLENSTTINDSAQLYNLLSDFSELLGQMNKSLEYHKKYIICIEKIYDPMNYIVLKLVNIEKYMLAGKIEDAYQIIKEAEPKLQPPVDKIISFGYMSYYLELDSADKAQSFTQEVKDLAIGFGQEMLLTIVYYSEGRIYELKEDYQKALESYKQFLEMKPLSVTAHRLLAKSYRKLGDLKEAKKELDIALKHKPYYPSNNYEAAMYYIEKGDTEKAKSHLQQAMEVWKHADEGYKPAIKAREKLSELGIS